MCVPCTSNYWNLELFLFELELSKTEYQKENLSEQEREINLDSSIAVKCTVVDFSIGLMQKVLVNIILKNEAYSPENKEYPPSHILCKPLGRRDTESPGVPVHNEL